MKLVLASASPRRADLLRQIGLDFTVLPSTIEEESICADSPPDLALKTAIAKARDVASRLEVGLIVGADTIVVLDGEIFGKPKDESDAKTILKKLSGRYHEVITGVSIVDAKTGDDISWAETTKVFFRELTDEEIISYVQTGIPLDKAGAYGIQDRAAAFVSRIEGCYFNVVGLPLASLVENIRRISQFRAGAVCTTAPAESDELTCPT